jgi:hypothetical protein
MKMKWIYLTLLAVADWFLSGYAAIKSGLPRANRQSGRLNRRRNAHGSPAEPAPQMIHQAAVIETVNVRLEDGVQPLAALEISGCCLQLAPNWMISRFIWRAAGSS